MNNPIHTKTTAKDFFLHLFSIVTLYLSAGALITLLFQYVNHFFPDVLNDYGYRAINGPLRFAISTLIVVFPLYVWSRLTLRKQFSLEPEKLGIAIRKWLIYFTLFVASLIIIGDLIAILNNFLSGELTVRFVLKGLSMMLVAGLTFIYYLLDMKEPRPSRMLKQYGFSISGVIAVLVIGAFFLVGSPAQQRLLQKDDLRVSNLQSIQNQVEQYWFANEKLPETLSVLEDVGIYGPVAREPETNESYKYVIVDEHKYQLCATFSLSNKQDVDSRKSVTPYGYYGPSWLHDAGEICFDLIVTEQGLGMEKPMMVR
jgi:hypothetical protein